MALPITMVIRIEGHQFAKRKAESQRPTFQKWKNKKDPRRRRRGAVEEPRIQVMTPSTLVFRSQPKYQDSWLGFPGGAVVENLPANAGDTGSSPGLGRSHMPRKD